MELIFPTLKIWGLCGYTKLENMLWSLVIFVSHFKRFLMERDRLVLKGKPVSVRGLLFMLTNFLPYLPVYPPPFNEKKLHNKNIEKVKR